MRSLSIAFVLIFLCSQQLRSQEPSPDEILLKDFQPKSIYNIPQTMIDRARFPVIDIHAHDKTRNRDEVRAWIKTMQEVGIKKTHILSMAHGTRFDELVAKYAEFDAHFNLWCGIDYTDFREPGWSDKAIAELERCHAMGAVGIGELGDKGNGLYYCKPPAFGMHFDDSRLRPVWKRAGELGMPINVHVAEPMWFYLPMDKHNDGLMNAARWQIDLSKDPTRLDHAALINTLENAVMVNPGTTFIACHLANCEYDLSILGRLFDLYPNLYADISARFNTTAPIPRYMRKFYDRYQDRLLYGTDMGNGAHMYQMTFRILESADEHFYLPAGRYHWACNGFDLPDTILKKVYHENAEKILGQRLTAMSNADGSGPMSLFNGQDLDGWHVDIPALDDDADGKSSFIVREGKLVSLGEPRGHLITDKEFENYRLTVQYRFPAAPGNCGVLVHASAPRVLSNMFPKSIEVQMMHENAGDFWCIGEDITVPNMIKRRGPPETWGGNKGDARRILNLTDGSELPLGEWNEMVIECFEDTIRVWVNGDLVNHGTGCTATHGHIALQAEGAEVEFRQLIIESIAETNAQAD